jgi:hypothetical protein
VIDRLRGILLLLGGVLCVANANAAPVRWTLSSDVLFTDDGVASGSFEYDADTGLYSSIDIITTPGNLFGGATYLFVDAASPFLSPTQVEAVTSTAADLTGTPVLALVFGAPLTDAGGTISIEDLGEGTCNVATCYGGTPIRSNLTIVPDGSVTTTPEPSTSALFVGGAGFIAWITAGYRFFGFRFTCSTIEN